MVNAYYPFPGSSLNSERCGICWCQFKDKDSIVAHGNNEKELLHPIHKECVKTWLLRKEFCPTCKVKIDSHSILPNRARLLMQKDIMLGLKLGTFLVLHANAAIAILSTVTLLQRLPNSTLKFTAGVAWSIGALYILSLYGQKIRETAKRDFVDASKNARGIISVCYFASSFFSIANADFKQAFVTSLVTNWAATIFGTTVGAMLGGFYDRSY